MPAPPPPGPRLVVVVENAHLEVARVRGRSVLLWAERHLAAIAARGESASNYRPDIVFDILRALLDSPLNRAGLLQVFVHTHRNVLIRVDPAVRLPRDYDRFEGLFVQLLQRRVIRAKGSNAELLRVVESRLAQQLPPGVPKFLLSRVAPTRVDLFRLARDLAARHAPLREGAAGTPILFYLGGFAHGPIPPGSVEPDATPVSVSDYGLSGSAVAARLTAAFEQAWGVR